MSQLTLGLSGAGPRASERKQDAPIPRPPGRYLVESHRRNHSHERSPATEDATVPYAARLQAGRQVCAHIALCRPTPELGLTAFEVKRCSCANTPNGPSSATRRRGRNDGNRDAPPGSLERHVELDAIFFR